MKLSAILVTLVVASVVAMAALATPAAPTANTLDANTYKVDPVHSSVVFKIRHMGVSNFYGRFNDFSGEFAFDPEDLDASKFDITVKATSIDTGNERRDGHLRSADFFTTDEYDTIRFKGTSVAPSKKEGMYDVTGELTLLGETKTITVPLQWFGTVEHERMGVVGGFETIFTIKRSDFGMDYGLEGDALGDEVTLMVSMEGRKAQPTSADDAE